MLITSRTVSGRCLICGTANCSCGGPSNVTPVDERVVNASMRGKLVQIPLRPGVSVQMYEEEARRQGLLPPRPPEPKARPQAPNKKRSQAPNK